MKTQNVWVSLAAVALLNGGCGTVCNNAYLTHEEGGERVFGGVRNDFDGLRSAANDESGVSIGGEEYVDRESQVGKLLFHMLDLPFTVVGDTLSLPYTIWIESSRRDPTDDERFQLTRDPLPVVTK